MDGLSISTWPFLDELTVTTHGGNKSHVLEKQGRLGPFRQMIVVPVSTAFSASSGTREPGSPGSGLQSARTRWVTRTDLFQG